MSEKTSSLKLIPVMLAFFAMVLDLLRPDGDVDEPYRAEKDRVIELDRNVSFTGDPDLRRRVYGHVDILLPVGYRQRFDADFLEPVIIEYRKRG